MEQRGKATTRLYLMLLDVYLDHVMRHVETEGFGNHATVSYVTRRKFSLEVMSHVRIERYGDHTSILYAARLMREELILITLQLNRTNPMLSIAPAGLYLRGIRLSLVEGRVGWGVRGS